MTGNLAFVFVVVFALLQTSRAKFESRENLSFVVNAVYSATDEVIRQKTILGKVI